MPDPRIGKGRHEVAEPVRPHHVVGVDHADDFGVACGMRKREAQCAGLVADKVVRIDELEALAERTAVLLDRPPEAPGPACC